MRILVQSHSAAPYNFGGAELALVELIDAWRDFAPSVEFLFVAPPPEGQLQREMASRGFAVRTVDFDPVVGVFPEPETPMSTEEKLKALSAIAAIRGAIREFDAEFVVTNTIVAPWAALAAAAEGVPHVWFAHEYGAAEHGLSFRLGRDSTFSDIASLSDLVVANSGELRDYLSSWVDPEKLEVLHPAIAPAEIRRLAAEPAATITPNRQGSLAVVCVGRVSEAKGQYLLLEAVARLRDEGTDVEAWFVGILAGGYVHEFERLIDALDLRDRVKLIGDLANPFVLAAAADVGVALSANESFGRVSLEYMALGLPVVATRTGVARSLIRDGEDGFVIALGSVDELVVALRTMAGDAELRARMGEAAAAQADTVHAMHPPQAVLSKLISIAPLGSARLPQSLSSVLGDSKLFERYAALPSEAEQRMRETATWRAGTAALAPLRAAMAVARRLRRD